MTKANHNKVVLLFGSFDPLHEGHRNCFRQAKLLGKKLVVVVSSDTQIREQKNHEPFLQEGERLEMVRAVEEVDEAFIGEATRREYRLLETLEFDVLAVGYDQRPEDAVIRQILEEIGKPEVEVVRLKPYYPDRYKSSLFKKDT